MRKTNRVSDTSFLRKRRTSGWKAHLFVEHWRFVHVNTEMSQSPDTHSLLSASSQLNLMEADSVRHCLSWSSLGGGQWVPCYRSGCGVAYGRHHSCWRSERVLAPSWSRCLFRAFGNAVVEEKPPRTGARLTGVGTGSLNDTAPTGIRFISSPAVAELRIQFIEQIWATAGNMCVYFHICMSWVNYRDAQIALFRGTHNIYK